MTLHNIVTANISLKIPIYNIYKKRRDMWIPDRRNISTEKPLKQQERSISSSIPQNLS